MLVLTRKPGESIVINGDIRVVVLSMEGNKCRLGVVAPPAVPVHRQEVFEKIKAHPNDPSPLTFTGVTTGHNSLGDELNAANTAAVCSGNLVLDFTNVRSVNSLELSTLVGLHERLLSRGACLTLIHLDANVREVFAVTRLDTFLTITAGQ